MSLHQHSAACNVHDALGVTALVASWSSVTTAGLVSRWLRFPCCGRRFACDLCHEEQTDGHEMKWAQRMVCGYCSHEQPLGEQCKHCGKRIARSAKGALGAATTHWQVCMPVPCMQSAVLPTATVHRHLQGSTLWALHVLFRLQPMPICYPLVACIRTVTHLITSRPLSCPPSCPGAHVIRSCTHHTRS